MAELQPVPHEPNIERIIAEPIIITPDSIWEDNYSPESQAGLATHDALRKAGRLTGRRRCPDARVEDLIPEETADMSYIAASGDFDSYKRLYDSSAFMDFIALGHYAGNTLGVGKAPTGCGGLAARAVIDSGKALDLKDVQAYAERCIPHPDVLVNTFLSASETSKRTDKDVLAAVQNHLDGSIVPFAFFSGRNSQYVSSINPDLLLHEYNPAEIYKLGYIASIPDSTLPAHLQHIVSEYRKRQMAMIIANPDYAAGQEANNPFVIYFSTDFRSPKLKVPKLAKTQNSIFLLNVPRTRIGDSIDIDEVALNNVIDQTEYPIAHAVKNKDKPGKSFSRTKTLYVETGSMDVSRDIVRRIQERPWMAAWDGQIIISKIRSGVIQDIAQLRPAA